MKPKNYALILASAPSKSKVLFMKNSVLISLIPALRCTRLLALLCILLFPAQATPRAYSVRTLRIQKRLYKAATSYPVFRNTGGVARLANKTLKNFAVDDHRAFGQEAQKLIKEFTPPGNLEHELTYVSGPFSGPRLISGHFAQYRYMGGAHPMTILHCFNFALSRGAAKQLTLGDFFHNDSHYQKRVTDALIRKLRVQKTDWIMDGSVKSFNTVQLNNFVAEKDGLHFFFDPYAVGPYAAGQYFVKLTAKELGPGFRMPS